MHRPQTDAERVLQELRLEASMALDPALARSAPTAVPATGAVRLALATVAWLGWVYALCYVALPSAGWMLGIGGSLDTALPSGVAWVGGAVVVAFAVLLRRPSVAADGRRDPIAAATLGGLAAWAIAENTLPVFQPFSAFGWGQLAWFAAHNLLEMGLLGAVWASLTRRPAVAFALGAGFQLLVTGVTALLLAI
jgi:hypothetical protein